jgi:glycosyltransferase involved in cell wall biosynthesis
MGFVKSIEEFYNSISLYIQPSVTEGFGIEVLEALATGRPVIASDGAGASDCLGSCGMVVERKNVKAIMDAIDAMKNNVKDVRKICQSQASNYTWDKIKNQYISVWRQLLT